MPSNMFAVVVLRYLEEIALKIYNDKELSQTCAALAQQVDAAIQQHAIVLTEEFGEIYAYELDGYGQYLSLIHI